MEPIKTKYMKDKKTEGATISYASNVVNGNKKNELFFKYTLRPSDGMFNNFTEGKNNKNSKDTEDKNNRVLEMFRKWNQ